MRGIPTIWQQREEERKERKRRTRRVNRVNDDVWEVEEALLELRRLRGTDCNEVFRRLYYLRGLAMQAPLPKKR